MSAAQRQPQIQRVLRLLRDNGLIMEAQRLEELGRGLTESLRQSSWFARNSGRVRAVLSRHAENASVEIGETAHLLRVARRLLVERRAVTLADMELARSQLLDLLKTVPASAIVAGTFLIPVPGAQPILAPVLMERLGLLPSAWSESALESQLRDLISMAGARKLESLQSELTKVLAAVRSHGEELKQLRRYVEENPDWAIFFDEDLDSRVSDQELAALGRRIDEAARSAISEPDEPCWTVYFRGDDHEDKIRSRLSYNEIFSAFPDARNALVRRSDGDWWVPLYAVLERIG